MEEEDRSRGRDLERSRGGISARWVVRVPTAALVARFGSTLPSSVPLHDHDELREDIGGLLDPAERFGDRTGALGNRDHRVITDFIALRDGSGRKPDHGRGGSSCLADIHVPAPRG